ncbi:MAG TPA: hypothetical protein P5038_11025, partial [Candidatus Paceibacterota bacterium]|nr:hypothetical protein [Candidatus Paceibacterota bacterium]
MGISAPTPVGRPRGPPPAPKPAPRPRAEAEDDEDDESATWEASDAVELGQVQEAARQALAGLLQHMSIQARVV